MQKLEEAYSKKDLVSLKLLSHQLRPLVVSSGMKDLNHTLTELENSNLWDSQVEGKLEKVIAIIRIKLSEYTEKMGKDEA